MKLGRRRNYHKGRAAIRHYANLREPSDSLSFKLYNIHTSLQAPAPRLQEGGQLPGAAHRRQDPQEEAAQADAHPLQGVTITSLLL